MTDHVAYMGMGGVWLMAALLGSAPVMALTDAPFVVAYFAGLVVGPLAMAVFVAVVYGLGRLAVWLLLRLPFVVEADGP